ncbi:hypothetical protein EBZ37_10170, partial [bacterium]|nr:hypothetical protein [bacterium]
MEQGDRQAFISLAEIIVVATIAVLCRPFSKEKKMSGPSIDPSRSSTFGKKIVASIAPRDITCTRPQVLAGGQLCAGATKQGPYDH